MNEHHIRAKVFLAAAERLEGVAATQTGAVRSAYREAADMTFEGRTPQRIRLVIWFPESQSRHTRWSCRRPLRGQGPQVRRGPGVTSPTTYDAALMRPGALRPSWADHVLGAYL